MINFGECNTYEKGGDVWICMKGNTIDKKYKNK